MARHEQPWSFCFRHPVCARCGARCVGTEGASRAWRSSQGWRICIYWRQEGKQVAIEYEGEADYAAVLGTMSRGSPQGYAQSVQSATPSAETHEYTKGRERMTLTITQPGGVSARIETTLQMNSNRNSISI
jgi:hypothetical protein